jgi:uncharacterized protein YbjQ (UPF0145 family)
VTDWLPPAAQARLHEAGGTWTSGLSVPEFAAIRSEGFEPMGQVMGSTVYNLSSWATQVFDCGYQFARSRSRVVSSSARSGSYGGFAAYVQTMYAARRTALGRMAAECAALGGDGVVATTLEVKPFPSAAGTLEFQAFGTAVRASGQVRPPRPFLSHLSGQEFAKLVAAGWVPVDLALGVSVAIRHDEWATNWASYGQFPQEMPGWTELVSRSRHDARSELIADVARSGADGVVLSDMDLKISERSCARGSQDQHDHVVEVTLLGTSVARFRHAAAPPRPLTIMRL